MSPNPPSSIFQLFPSTSPATFSLNVELPKSGTFLLFFLFKEQKTGTQSGGDSGPIGAMAACVSLAPVCSEP